MISSEGRAVRRLPACRKPHEQTPLDLPEQSYTDPEYPEFNGVPFGHFLHLQRELLQIADRGVVDLEEEVARLYAGPAGELAPALHASHGQSEADAPQLLRHEHSRQVVHERIDGYGEADVLRLRADGRGDADELAVDDGLVRSFVNLDDGRFPIELEPLLCIGRRHDSNEGKQAGYSGNC